MVEQAKYCRLRNCDRHNIVRLGYRNTHSLQSLFLADLQGCEFWDFSSNFPFLAISIPFPCKSSASYRQFNRVDSRR